MDACCMPTNSWFISLTILLPSIAAAITLGKLSYLATIFFIVYMEGAVRTS
jgi:ABC-type multidrug transport system permease subunit